MHSVPSLPTPIREHESDELDIAFQLPTNITDPDLRALYDVLVRRMRKEVAHLPMQTVQLLLIERIAYNYIIMRHKEAAESVAEGAFTHATQQKEFNMFWLAMTQELNKQMRTTDAEFKAQVMKTMASAVVGVLRDIDDPVLQAKLRIKIADELERTGL